MEGNINAKGKIKGQVSIPEIIEGMSAYGIAVKNGFEGTEAEWLESLKGEQGDIGPQGPQGEKGDTGATGPRGVRGTGILTVTTSPTNYETTVDGKKVTFRILQSTVLNQSGLNAVVGDKIAYKNLLYDVVVIEGSYVYLNYLFSMRGSNYVLTEADKQEIADMTKPTIDQSYSPESENPQSGTAVAEAIETTVGKKTEQGGEIFNDYERNEANALYSHASGTGTIASSEAQTVIGKYNKQNSDALFIVGNGTSDTERSNAFSVDEKGSVIIGEGETSSEGSISGGTTDKSLAEGLVGSLANLIYLTPSKASAPLTVSYGANNESVVAGCTTYGVQNVAGVKGVYWDTIDFSTNTIKLCKTRRISTLKSPTYFTESDWKTEDNDTDYVVDWEVGDVISIVNDKQYCGCTTIKSIDKANSTITVDSLPFTEIAYKSTLTTYTYTYPFDRGIYAIYENDKTDLTDKGKSRWETRTGIVDFGFVSMALGATNLTTGTLSFAVGKDNWSAAENSGAVGLRNQALGMFSFAKGIDCVASGTDSSAEGSGSKATGSNSHAEGYSTLASGSSAHAEGYKTNSTGSGSHAEGYETTASTTGAHAEGFSTEASGAKAHAEGVESKATNEASHAEGAYTLASGEASHAEGNQTTSEGNYSHAEGLSTKSNGMYSHAEGDNTIADGKSSHAEGSQTNSVGKYSHTEGYQTTASGADSHAEGSGTTASSSNSHAEGYKSTASGSSAHAEGFETKSEGSGSHSEGYMTTATNTGAHAEGFGTIASGSRAHAEGQSTTALGDYSHSEGENTRALNKGSHAGGLFTQTSTPYQTVIGTYNKDDANALFIIGNGTSDENRRNAFEVYKDGHVEVKAVGDTDESVVNKQYVDKVKTELETEQEDKFKAFLLDIEHPVGSLYLAPDETVNPSALFGGTWEKQTVKASYHGTTYMFPNGAAAGDNEEITVIMPQSVKISTPRFQLTCHTGGPQARSVSTIGVTYDSNGYVTQFVIKAYTSSAVGTGGTPIYYMVAGESPKDENGYYYWKRTE